MINATEMAKIFDQKVERFMRTDTTRNFIAECQESYNSSFLNIESEKDLYYSKKGKGTWMHRMLALKFAAWLSPKFELWVYSTIDQILFGEYYRLKAELTASAERKQRIEELEMELSEDDRFRELEELKKQERRSVYRRGKVIKNQLQLFRNQI